VKDFSFMPAEAGIDLILISEDFRNHDYCLKGATPA